MSNLLTARSRRAALAATFLIPFASAASAQSADGRSTADIEKENAALRAKVHRLEVEKENIGLRAKVDQLQGRRPTQAAASQDTQAAPQPLVTRIETTGPDRTLVMADLPMKAAPVYAPLYSWSGFYLGGNIGYAVADDRARSSVAFGVISNASAIDTAVTPAGGIGGVQIGYNWQGGPNWLVGFEADIQASSQKGTSCVIVCTNIPANANEAFTVTETLDYFGTVRGRFGFVDRGNLFYVTGGGAYGHVNETLGMLIIAQGGSPAFTGSGSTGETKFGWVVGAGMESSLGGNWTAKVEYLYMDLGSTATNFTPTLPGNLIGVGPQAVPFNNSASLRDNIVRAGVNYRFGPPAGPVSAYDAMAAVPPAVYSWTGFYVGANVGYGFGNDHSQIDEAAPTVFPGLATSAPGTSVAPRGGLGGAQIGYNWQSSAHWLAGFEADFQGTTMNDTVCSSLVCFNQTSGGLSLANAVTVQHQLDYFGTLRGRVGAVVNNTLFYATGGGAFGHERETINVNSPLSTPADFANQVTAKDLFGYAVGGGIEAMVWSGWSVKAEYLYLNLGSFSQMVPFGSGAASATLSSNSEIRDHIVRIGANYHLGAAPY